MQAVPRGDVFRALAPFRLLGGACRDRANVGKSERRHGPLAQEAGVSVDGHAGEVGGDTVGGVPVEVGAGHVTADGRASVGVPHRALRVPQRQPR